MAKRGLPRIAAAILSVALLVPAAAVTPVVAQDEGPTVTGAWIGPCCNEIGRAHV